MLKEENRTGGRSLRLSQTNRLEIYNLQFTIYDLRFTIYDLRFTIYDLRFTIYDLRFIWGIKLVEIGRICGREVT